jgi:hypothetical protein
VIEFVQADCLEWMREQPEGRFDLVFGSPPYEDARTYGIDFNLKGQDWVDWMVSVFRESLRICKGLVAFVVEGRTNDYRYTATPLLLMADLHRAGITLRKPPLYIRDGIPGSGGPDFLKNRYEFIVCATNGGKLPWSDNTACGHECKYPPGGAMSNRTKTGLRVGGMRRANGKRRLHGYTHPKIANPGNWLEFPDHGVGIDCGPGGGGHLGNDLAHENEAPFPLGLAEFFVKSFCQPGGWCLDPFSGSGTTAEACEINGRNCVGVDIRESQIELGERRCRNVQKVLV